MVNIEEIFPKTKITIDDEKEFKKYVRLKGIYLYKEVFDILCKTDEMVTYREMSNIIRYDKYLRKKLYEYLSALEEQWRSLVFDNFDYDDIKENILSKPIDIKKVIPKRSFEESNFYFATFNRDFTFNKLSNIIKSNRVDLIIIVNDEDIDKIVKLRNIVMHHNLLLISYYQEIKDINQNITFIENCIEKLWIALDDVYREAFAYCINNGNYKKANLKQKPNLSRFCLGKFKNGVFNKKTSKKE